ncbi:sugar ABC transporter permease [Microbacterium sp. LWS13-1.2]|uniref:Sugar ABC transporter permease n=1 Tax=Microbacterium sp. LWS13-1.2 TaxID=3135264 RepID=A0AAU6SAR3_9MICO
MTLPSGVTVTAPRRKRAVSWTNATPYLLVAPAIVLVLMVQLGPMLVGIIISFFDLTRLYITNWSGAPFVALENYVTALSFASPVGGRFLQSVGITIAFTVIVVTLCYLLGMSAAVVLQRTFRGKGWFRTLFLLPYALPVYASVIVWSFMFQRDNGLINHVLVDTLHLVQDPPFWLLGDNAFWSMVIVAVWNRWPFAFLMLMAGLQSIPEEVYQASSIDGASVWKQVRYITIPMLAPVNFVLILMMSLWTFNDFNHPFVLFGPTPPPAANLISMHIYNNSFINWNFGLGSAMSVLALIFLLAASGVALWLNRRSNREL